MFLTSGTTGEVRGRHELFDTSLYRASALASGGRWLLPRPPYRFVLLAPSDAEDPSSSLSFMLARFAEAFGDGHDDPWMVHGGQLQVDRVRSAVDQAGQDDVPVALLGTSFAFVHLLDGLPTAARLPCPDHSVVLATGGFKGRSRQLEPEALFAAIGEITGLPRASVVQEYGMTELSSQAYEDPGTGRPPGIYVAPPG